MISTGDDPLQFVVEFFTSPVSIVLFAALAITVLSPDRAVGQAVGHRQAGRRLRRVTAWKRKICVLAAHSVPEATPSGSGAVGAAGTCAEGTRMNPVRIAVIGKGVGSEPHPRLRRGRPSGGTQQRCRHQRFHHRRGDDAHLRPLIPHRWCVPARLRAHSANGRRSRASGRRTARPIAFANRPSAVDRHNSPLARSSHSARRDDCALGAPHVLMRPCCASRFGITFDHNNDRPAAFDPQSQPADSRHPRHPAHKRRNPGHGRATSHQHRTTNRRRAATAPTPTAAAVRRPTPSASIQSRETAPRHVSARPAR